MATFTHAVGVGRSHNQSPKEPDSCTDSEDEVLMLMKSKIAQKQTQRKAVALRSARDTSDNSDSSGIDESEVHGKVPVNAGEKGTEPRTKVNRRTAVNNALRSAEGLARDSSGDAPGKRAGKVNPSTSAPKPTTTPATQRTRGTRGDDEAEEDEVHISVTCQPLRSGAAQGKKHRALQQAAKGGDGDGEEGLLCHVCKVSFGSRNQLFKHIKETGHALAVPQPQETKNGASKTEKKKGKKR
jgi:DnaJ family protein A protein 5